MNYALQFMYIKADWFDYENEERKILKIGSEGFNLYINLFRFCIPRQETKYLFFTNIALLRKVTGYKTEKVLELLKVLKNNGVIKMNNCSKWTVLYDSDGKLKEDKLLEIEAADYPDIVDTENYEEAEDYWIMVDLDLFSHYIDCGLDERYYPLFCLIRRLSNNQERKSTMTIQKMADVLGYNKNTLNKMIESMNKAKVLKSVKKPNGKNGTLFEHRLCIGKKFLRDF